MSPGDGLGSELESFRKQWLSDLESQKKSLPLHPAPASSSSSATQRRRHSHHRRPEIPPTPSQPSAPPASSSRISRSSRQLHSSLSPVAAASANSGARISDQGPVHFEQLSIDEPVSSAVRLPIGRTTAESNEADVPTETQAKRAALVSALDHYEEAMKKEAQGNMGESLQLYRQAYRKQMDHGVDRRYREKYFPATSHTKTSTPTPPVPAQSVASPPATGLPKGPPGATTAAASTPSRTFSELISSFETFKIQPATPDNTVEGEPPPPPLPCPIAALPDELLTHILLDVAITDVTSYVRLSLVCRRLAYLVASEQRIWRRVCLGPEFGFSGMHYRWKLAIEWRPLSSESTNEQESDSDSETPASASPREEGDDCRRRNLSPHQRAERRRAHDRALTLSLTPSVYPTWKVMFRDRPRIRFDGCYISTVNYVRSGSDQPTTWSGGVGGAPICIVTYYRYLRFFRDGSLVSLVASHEPAEVVRHLTRDALLRQRNGTGTGTGNGIVAGTGSHLLPDDIVCLARRGRWCLSPPRHPSEKASTTNNNRQASGSSSSPSGDDELSIETEGVSIRYVFSMRLLVRGGGGGGRTATSSSSSSNTPRTGSGSKLLLRGFCSYDKRTDSWDDFLLKNEKPFFFSRVRSYGLGE